MILSVNLRISMSQTLINKFLSDLWWLHLYLLHFLIMRRENLINNLWFFLSRRSNCSLLGLFLSRFKSLLNHRNLFSLLIYNYFTCSWRNRILLDKNCYRRWHIIDGLEGRYCCLVTAFQDKSDWSNIFQRFIRISKLCLWFYSGNSMALLWIHTCTWVEITYGSWSIDCTFRRRIFSWLFWQRSLVYLSSFLRGILFKSIL